MVSRGTPTKSESDKNDKPPKLTEEEVEEFGEDKEVKKSTKAIVDGAKTGNINFYKLNYLAFILTKVKEMLSPKPLSSLTMKSLILPMRRTQSRNQPLSSNPGNRLDILFCILLIRAA